MSRVAIPRPDLAARLRAALEAAPAVLTGPPGAGKTTLLLGLARALESDGWATIYLDLMGAVSSPDRFVRAALDALGAQHFGERLREAIEIRGLVDSGRPHHAQAVRAVFALWSSLNAAGERPVALLLDEITEIRSLAYFPGLREADRWLADALAKRKRGTLAATSFPTLARRSFDLAAVTAAPLAVQEIGSVLPGIAPAGVGALAAASFGWPRYAAVLIERVRAGADVAAAWEEEMTKGGRLEAFCHHTYETLLLRSRGYGISKAVLDTVAQEEGQNLKALVARLGRTPGATRDYLQWLVGVDAIRMEKKRYFYVDGLVRWWVRLHATGRPATAADIGRAAREVTATTPALPAGPEETAAGPAATAPPRTEDLMEID